MVTVFAVLRILKLVYDLGVGKSWILSRFANDRPPDDHIRPTVGIDFKMKDMVVDNIRCKLQVWDTSGDPTYLSITNSYLPNAANIVLVYDVTLLASFTKLLEHWIPEIERSCRTEVQIMLIGNKCDAPSDQRVRLLGSHDNSLIH